MTISAAASFYVFMQVAKHFMLYIHFSLIVRKAGAAAVCQLPHLSGYTKWRRKIRAVLPVVKEGHLGGIRKIPEGAHALEGLKVRLGNLRAGRADLVDGDKLPPALPAMGQVLSGRFTEAGHRDKRRKNRAVIGDQEADRIGTLKINRRKTETAQVELVHRLQRNQQVLAGLSRCRRPSFRCRSRPSGCGGKNRQSKRPAAHVP